MEPSRILVVYFLVGGHIHDNHQELPSPTGSQNRNIIKPNQEQEGQMGFMFLLSMMSLGQLITGMTMKLMIAYCLQTDAQLQFLPYAQE